MRLFSRISSNEPVPSDTSQIDYHFETVAYNMDLSRWIMSPADWDFNSIQAMVLGQEQDLRIKTKALDALLLKDYARPREYKCLKPALCIMKVNPGHQPYEFVENDACKFAQPRLADCYESAIRSP